MSLLDGRIAIVTGAARGLGAAFARALGKNGASVVLCDVLPEVEAVAEVMSSEGGDATALCADVSRPDDVRRVVEAARNREGRLDLLINNAGIFAPTRPGDGWERALSDFEAIVDTNLRGPFLFGRAVAEVMIEAGGGGDIVNISTDHVAPPPGRATGGGSGMDIYDASKWGLRGLTEAWARSLRGHDIRVNALCMGATDTDMIRSAFPGEPSAEEVATWMRPEAVAALLVDLLAEGPGGRSGESIGIWSGHPIQLPAPRLKSAVEERG